MEPGRCSRCGRCCRFCNDVEDQAEPSGEPSPEGEEEVLEKESEAGKDEAEKLHVGICTDEHGAWGGAAVMECN